MRVVKQPDTSKWHKRVKCTRCRAQLEVDVGDLTACTDDVAAMFTCGHCGDDGQKLLRVGMPEHIWAAARVERDGAIMRAIKGG